MVPYSLIPLLTDTNAMLAGGAAFSMNSERLINRSVAFTDYDFFFENEADYLKALSNFIDPYDIKTKITYESKFSTHIRFQSDGANGGVVVNLVKIYKPHKKTIEGFDLKNSQFFSMFPYDKVESYFSTEQEFVLLEEVQLNTPLTVKLLNRVYKYYQTKGLTIDKLAPEICNYLKSYKTFTKIDYSGTTYDDSEKAFSSANDYIGYLFVSFCVIPSIRELFKQEPDFWIPFELSSYDQVHKLGPYFSGADWALCKELNSLFDGTEEIQPKTRKYIATYFPEKLL